MAAVVLVALAVAATSFASAQPAMNQDGDLVVALDGGISPTVLPRDELRPVAVRVSGDIRDASGASSRLPQLRRITVAINRRGRLFYRGLPVCHVAAIQPAREAVARRICGDSIVGSGHVRVQVRILGQLPFEVEAPLLAFNGPRRNGHKLILAQVYADKPPGSFVLVFRVGKRKGELGTVLSTRLGERGRDWAYLTHFELRLHRLYEFKGRQRSFVSAACKAPSGFHSAPYLFAEATYDFADGRSLAISLARTCRVAAQRPR